MVRLSPLVVLSTRLEANVPRQRPMSHEVCRISGRSFGYGLIEGDGPTVVLLHGWGLGHLAYEPAAREIAARGYRLVVPDLPGFGQSSDPPVFGLRFENYAASVSSFLDSCSDLDGEPVHLVGHSFGGAVTVQVAHDRPELVASAVLVCSVGTTAWLRDGSSERLLRDRPLWDWCYHLIAEFPTGHFPRAALGLLRELSHNVVWHPASLGLLAGMIRQGDLRDKLERLQEAGLPAAVVWAEQDRVVTRACFDDQCRALGVNGRVVKGNHGWPLSAPGSFGETISEILDAMEASSTFVA